ncbi:hypothetical protein QUF74_12530 [Candidatus Halobeggiatoa sp. HSG11]|nr:hypothetical protein [Candidatus Halobeggiatoa sp. HSG11]
MKSKNKFLVAVTLIVFLATGFTPLTSFAKSSCSRGKLMPKKARVIWLPAGLKMSIRGSGGLLWLANSNRRWVKRETQKMRIPKVRNRSRTFWLFAEDEPTRIRTCKLR